MDMSSPTVRLLTIGEFSRLSRLSIRMLRHYDERDVLRPAEVDPVSGYRYFHHGQLSTALRVRTLRDLGLSVAEIGAMLPLFDDPAALSAALAGQRGRLVAQAEAVRSQIAEVDRLIDTLKEIPMSIDVSYSVLPASIVASLRDVIPTYADEGRLWARLMPAVMASGAVMTTPPVVSAVFHDEDYRESDVDVEVRVSVAAPFTPAGGVDCVQVPERPVVSAMLHGSYDQMGQITAALGAVVAERGEQLDGPMFNIYLVGPTQNPDPEHWLTQVCLPVRPA